MDAPHGIMPVTPIPASDESSPEALEQLLQALDHETPVCAGGNAANAAYDVVGPALWLASLGWNAAIGAAVPALCGALGAWLASRSGRKVRIKIGDIEAEAHTQEEVEKLLAHAQEIQQQNSQRNQQPKVIQP
jgi:hypothetical protein